MGTGRGRRTTLAVLLAASVGCRSYAPLPSARVDAGRRVRVRLTDAGSAQLAPLIGPRGAAVEGTVVVSDDSSLTLDARAITRVSGDDERWPGERVEVRRTAVAGVDVVRTSVRRSALLAGAMVAGALVLRLAFGGTESVRPGGGSGGGAGGR